MEHRGQTTRLAAARIVIIAVTVAVGASVIFALAYLSINVLTIPGYRPKALHNTILSICMVVSGLLALRWIRISLDHGMVFYTLANMAILVTMYEMDYRTFVMGADSQPSVNVAPALYVPHLGILMVALIAGTRPALVTAAGGAVYLILLGRFTMPDDWGALGIPFITALALPFTAVLVERLLEEVEKTARRAQQAETSISIMTHDLGNPLTVLASSLEMLRENDLSDDHRETLVWAIQRNTHTLRRLLEEFREFPHLDKAMPMKRADFKDIVEDVVEFYAQPLAKGYGQTLSADLQSVEVMGTVSRLSRVVRELLTNAIKYTPRGGHVEVTLQADEHVIFRVSDNGWGIKEDELAYVFDPHWRGSSASPRNVSGTGLGLYICKTIAECHGGRIEVESELNKGSTFRLYLPLPDATSAASFPNGASAEETTESRPRISLPGQR